MTELTAEQARAVALALRAADSGHVAGRAVDVLEAHFPSFDWWSLTDPEMARRQAEREVQNRLDRSLYGFSAQMKDGTRMDPRDIV